MGVHSADSHRNQEPSQRKPQSPNPTPPRVRRAAVMPGLVPSNATDADVFLSSGSSYCSFDSV